MCKIYWRQLTEVQKDSIASELGTSTEYLRLVVTGHKKPGAAFAKKLHDVTEGAIDKHQLRPDIF
ncbi:helix-turn-helix domain-containing protein [Vibrio coralliilyticus]|uniref:Uncharacterized protein n=1 Tax=Vibrio coralliilyticus TaxID=190893 RepID=A0AAN0SEY5_9VIBR|nr:hypothetical protein [Vibrio coralliilyticus]AIW21334.1 hypothetical protein IX92_20175 [Vibrio coralliilyticus]NOH40943.1 helix-turn-helix domain-containing protein [Vibrio coralliilyticus]